MIPLSSPPMAPLPWRDFRHPRWKAADSLPSALAATMHTDRVDTLAGQVQAALVERQDLLPEGFACHTAARRIADRYLNAADGTSRFWITRPRPTAGARRPTAPAVYEVLRSDGRIGVWDALTPEEGDVIANILTTLSL